MTLKERIEKNERDIACLRDGHDWGRIGWKLNSDNHSMSYISFFCKRCGYETIRAGKKSHKAIKLMLELRDYIRVN